MRITKEQEEYLNSFTCKRLSSDDTNRALINNFVSSKGESLVGYLKHRAWDEDITGEVAYYLIKSPEGVPCLFFSLKCGTIFEPFDEEGIQQYIKKLQEIKDSIHSPDDLISVAVKLGVSPIELISILKRDFPLKQQKLKIKKDDEKKETNEAILRVHKTLPGIELVHFCADDNEKKKWYAKITNHAMGETLFWFFIVPIIEKMLELVGCQYIYLFAADSTVDGTLMNYYDVYLKFSNTPNFGTSKPLYDFGCFFMHQKIDELIRNKNMFFDAFNKDDEDIII